MIQSATKRHMSILQSVKVWPINKLQILEMKMKRENAGQTQQVGLHLRREAVNIAGWRRLVRTEKERGKGNPGIREVVGWDWWNKGSAYDGVK